MAYYPDELDFCFAALLAGWFIRKHLARLTNFVQDAQVTCRDDETWQKHTEDAGGQDVISVICRISKLIMRLPM
jgi:hypothetical protein